jgi:hypothetical protein
MSKVKFNCGRNPEERKLIPDRTKEIASDMRSKYGGDFVRITHICEYLQCCRASAYNYLDDDTRYGLKRVHHACGTKLFRVDDVAKRLAEREALCG